MATSGALWVSVRGTRKQNKDAKRQNFTPKPDARMGRDTWTQNKDATGHNFAPRPGAPQAEVLVKVD